MASAVIRKSSEEIIGLKCFTCHKKDKVRKSQKFCVECQSHFCIKCLKAHAVLHDDHTLKEPSKVTDHAWLPTDRCPKHQTKLMDTYCKDHDDVCCNTCAFKKHRSCKTVLYIPNEVGQLFKRKELQRASTRLEKVKYKLTEGEKLMNRQTEILLTEKEKQLTVVDSYVETLVTIIRYLGIAEKERLNSAYKEVEDKLQQNTEASQSVQAEIQKCKNQLHSQDDNKAQLFITIKKSQKVTTNAEQLLQEVQKIINRPSPQFKSDRQIEQYLACLQSLGSVVDKPLLLDSKQNIRPQSLRTSQLPELYKVGQMQNISIRIKGDLYNCFICDSCLLPDGSLLLSDYNNMKLKCLNTTTYNVTDHWCLTSRPQGVCCISQQEAAVCLSNNTIQFISVVPHKMTLIRSIQLNHPCLGICYWDNKLCVSNNQDVLFYTLSGSLIKSGNLGLLNVENITCSQSGNVLYVTDLSLGLIGVDKSGREIFRYCGQDLDGCTSICKADSGSVIIWQWLSENVVQVTENGQYLGVVVPWSDCELDPWALSFDSINRRLFLAGYSDTLTQIKLM